MQQISKKTWTAVFSGASLYINDCKLRQQLFMNFIYLIPKLSLLNTLIMKKIFILPALFVITVSCRWSSDVETAKQEILETEKAFKEMAFEKGLAEAFYFFADENAVIMRGNDSLIFGKENIRNFYDSNADPNATLIWTPDFVEVSDCGTLGYTYGGYIFSIQDDSAGGAEQTGIYHTVWKKQNNVWRYVWD